MLKHSSFVLKQYALNKQHRLQIDQRNSQKSARVTSEEVYQDPLSLLERLPITGKQENLFSYSLNQSCHLHCCSQSIALNGLQPENVKSFCGC